jgi:hypothetical protein
VHIIGWVDLIYIKAFFLLLIITITPFSFLFNFIYYCPATTTTCNSLTSASRRRYISLLLFIIGTSGVL